MSVPSSSTVAGPTPTSCSLFSSAQGTALRETQENVGVAALSPVPKGSLADESLAQVRNFPAFRAQLSICHGALNPRAMPSGDPASDVANLAKEPRHSGRESGLSGAMIERAMSSNAQG